MSANEPVSTPDHMHDLLAAARRLGADHALAVASWTIFNEEEAASVLKDVDPAVWDKSGWPNLSGEWADDPTPATLLRDLGLDPGEVGAELESSLCDAWQEIADEVFVAALEAMALRLLDRVDEAFTIERSLEAIAMPGPDDALSLQDVIWVLACLTAGAVDLADGVSGEQFDARALGLPMNQTVRLKDGRYVTCVLLLGDADDFNRTFG